MSTPLVDTRDRHLIAVIGDQDTVTGMLLAGIGALDIRQRRNYLIADAKTTDAQLEEAFKQFTKTRHDIAIILLTHSVAARIRHLVNEYNGILPVVLEIPSKEGEDGSTVGGSHAELKRPPFVS